MKFRPCIDIHNGKVKQIVGGSLTDNNETAKENFISKFDSDYYAKMYKQDNLSGGHIILLNPLDSHYYEENILQAKKALSVYPGGFQIGGGINDLNAVEFLSMGASHVIVTSFVFNNGNINYENLEKLVIEVGKENLVLDLSCRQRDGEYYIVTDRWQKFTDVIITNEVLEELSFFCDEFLIHAVDVEGKVSGIEEKLVEKLSKFDKIPITYAGGVSCFGDLDKLKEKGNNKLDVTIGSALDLFGGKLKYKQIIEYLK